jgi:hypothetical protein
MHLQGKHQEGISASKAHHLNSRRSSLRSWVGRAAPYSWSLGESTCVCTHVLICECGHWCSKYTDKHAPPTVVFEIFCQPVTVVFSEIFYLALYVDNELTLIPPIASLRRDLCVKTFMELRRHHNKVVLLLEMLSQGNEHLPVFAGNKRRVLSDLRRRFRTELYDRAAVDFVHELINESLDNWTTTCYDRYQRCCVGIFWYQDILMRHRSCAREVTLVMLWYYAVAAVGK